MVTAREVLLFVFGPHETSDQLDFSNFHLFFQKNPEFDRQIKTQFEAAINQALAGEFDHWAEESPLHGVALVVLLDQFSRNMYRGTAQAFAYDSKALGIAMKVIEKGWHMQLPLPARTFLYIALEHSERLEVQRQLLSLVEEMIAEAPEQFRESAAYFKTFAQQHYDIIERFGRFPHRNAALGRQSTEEEVEFVKVHPGF